MVFQCPYCLRRFENVETFRFLSKYTHERMEELNLLIPDKLRRILEEHANEEREEKLEFQSIQKCKSCGAEFYDQDELFRFHEGLHQGQDLPDISYSFRKVNKERTKQTKLLIGIMS